MRRIIHILLFLFIASFFPVIKGEIPDTLSLRIDTPTDICGFYNLDTVSVNKIILYGLQSEFYFSNHDAHDNFYNLLIGKKLDMSEYPHATCQSKDSIDMVLNMLAHYKKSDISIPSYPTFPYNIRSFIVPDVLSIAKQGDVFGLILIYMKDNKVLVILDRSSSLWIDGHIFVIENENYNPYDDFREILNTTKPDPNEGIIR
ncbi:MAG: hypothetical protein NC082_02490 [Clostridiales bacterium]|nr:hypothetical protein [Clostridiales bacterium]